MRWRHHSCDSPALSACPLRARSGAGSVAYDRAKLTVTQEGAQDARRRGGDAGQAGVEPHAQRLLGWPERLGRERHAAPPRGRGKQRPRRADRLRGPRRRHRGARLVGRGAGAGKRPLRGRRPGRPRIRRHAGRRRRTALHPDHESGRPAPDFALQHLPGPDTPVRPGGARQVLPDRQAQLPPHRAAGRPPGLLRRALGEGARRRGGCGPARHRAVRPRCCASVRRPLPRAWDRGGRGADRDRGQAGGVQRARRVGRRQRGGPRLLRRHHPERRRAALAGRPHGGTERRG